MGCSLASLNFTAVSIQQHQGVSRHRNEDAQALQRELGLQDDGISMILSKQSESTKVGLSGLFQLLMNENRTGNAKRTAARRQARHSFKSAWIMSNICDDVSESGHM